MSTVWLTKRQAEMIRYMHEYDQEHGYPPTLQEFGDAFNLAKSNARYNLEKLEEMGLVQRTPYVSRGTTLTDLARSWLGDNPTDDVVRKRAPVLRATARGVKNTAPLLIELLEDADDRGQRERLLTILGGQFDDLLGVADEALNYAENEHKSSPVVAE